MAIAKMRELAGVVQAEVVAVGLQETRFQIVRQVGRDYLSEDLIQKHGILDAEDDFDAFVDIALHPIGAAEEQLGLTAVAEDEDAAVLQESPYDAAHANAAAEAADTGAQGARAADDQVDLHTGLRGAVERLDNFFVEQRIEFGEDE